MCRASGVRRQRRVAGGPDVRSRPVPDGLITYHTARRSPGASLTYHTVRHSPGTPPHPAHRQGLLPRALRRSEPPPIHTSFYALCSDALTSEPAWQFAMSHLLTVGSFATYVGPGV